MNDTKDSNGVLLPNDLRVTKIGAIVRRYSIDELPQLFNVLFGQMSLIGPRPLIFEYIPLYSKNQMRRHEVRPGITGWAQVNGRNSISWSEKFEYDVWYVDNNRFLVDVKIILLTLKKVFIKEHIDFDPSIKKRRFNGNN
jgi:lipopolysaccharide/colanic/teichoic acid biosynthesis glycosyltransferase